VEHTIAARIDVPAGQIVNRAHRRGTRAGHHHFIDVRARGIGEVHTGLQFRPDRNLGNHEVDLAVDQRRPQHVARHGHEDHVDPGVASLVLRVELILEGLPHLVGDAPLHALVREVEGPVEGDAHADEPPGDHLVEVAGKRRVEHAADGFRQGSFVRHRLRLIALRRRFRRTSTGTRRNRHNDREQGEPGPGQPECRGT